jgi:hypothetical protein
MESRVFFSATPATVVVATPSHPAITVTLTKPATVAPHGPVFLNPQPLPP